MIRVISHYVESPSCTAESEAALILPSKDGDEWALKIVLTSADGEQMVATVNDDVARQMLGTLSAYFARKKTERSSPR